MLLKRVVCGRAARQLQGVTARTVHTNSINSSSGDLGAVGLVFHRQAQRVKARFLSNSAKTIQLTARSFATNVASRPKSHTGRATGTRRTKTATSKNATKARGRPPAKKSAKPKPKPKPKKKVVSPEMRQKNKIINLKKQILTPPKQLPSTAFMVICQEQSGSGIALRAKEASARYHSLSPSERENYNHIANENKSKNQEAYERWVRSIPATDIKQSNEAGKTLLKLGARKQYTKIRDDRLPKQPSNAHVMFVRDRYATGDMAGLRAPDALKLILREWHELSSAQKQKYVDAAARDRERYASEIKQVSGV